MTCSPILKSSPIVLEWRIAKNVSVPTAIYLSVPVAASELKDKAR
jgi:hypothetical protein